jgi:drug/metabolite transporter (DMT)-like permease
MMLGVPVIAAPSAWIILGESLGPLQVVGGAVTIAGIAIVVGRPEGAAAERERSSDPAVPPL